MKYILLAGLISGSFLWSGNTKEPRSSSWTAGEKALYLCKATWPSLASMVGATISSFVAQEYIKDPKHKLYVGAAGNVIGAVTAHYVVKPWLLRQEQEIEKKTGKKVPFSVNGSISRFNPHLWISALGGLTVAADVMDELISEKNKVDERLTEAIDTLGANNGASQNGANALIDANINLKNEIAQLKKEAENIPLIPARGLAAAEARIRRLQAENARLRGTVTSATHNYNNSERNY